MPMALKVSKKMVLLFMTCLPAITAGVDPVVTLYSNITFGGLICPTSFVSFTCTAIDATVLEWRRNNVLLTAPLLPTSSIGPVKDNDIPSGFTVNLIGLEREGTSQFANFTSVLVAELSKLVNGKDQIMCDSLEEFHDTINVMYSGIRTAPSAPLFSHTFSSGLRDGEVTLTLTWDETFTTTNAVEMYCVRSDLCPKQCVGPDTPFSCPVLVAGGEYMFWVTAFNCDDQEGEESQPLVVHPQVPNLPPVPHVVATYNRTSENDTTLESISIMWRPEPEIRVTEEFVATTVYTVNIKTSTGDQAKVMNVTCDQSEGTCSTLFPLLEAADYTVSISARNIVGRSNVTIYPNEILSSSSSYYDPSFSFENCITSVLCSSSLDLSDITRCVVHYGTNPSYTTTLHSDPVDGPLNSIFQLPLLEPTTTYYFQTSVLINSTLTVQVQEKFITGEFDARLSRHHLGLIIAGTICWVFVVITIIVLSITLKIRKHSSTSSRWFYVSMVTLFVVIAILTIVAMVLWIGVGTYTGVQQNTCDLQWKRVRNGLIVSAFALSTLCLIISLAAVIFLVASWMYATVVVHQEKKKAISQQKKKIEEGVRLETRNQNPSQEEYQHLDHSLKKPLPPSTDLDYQQLDHGPRRPLPPSDDYQQLDTSTSSIQFGIPLSDHQYDEPFTGPLYPSLDS